jgi:hypothetical protein
MAICGHKTETAFKKYIKADRIINASMIKVLWIISRVCSSICVNLSIDRLVDRPENAKPTTGMSFSEFSSGPDGS